jgi:hypothetical protein
MQIIEILEYKESKKKKPSLLEKDLLELGYSKNEVQEIMADKTFHKELKSAIDEIRSAFGLTK